MTCERVPYLPPAGQTLGESAEAAILDRQFRLLREDLMGPMRQELKQLDLSRCPHAMNVRFEGIGTNRSGSYVWASMLLPQWHPVNKVRTTSSDQRVIREGGGQCLPHVP